MENQEVVTQVAHRNSCSQNHRQTHFETFPICVVVILTRLRLRLTFQRAITDPLLDFGLVQQIGGVSGEDELPRTRAKAVAVVLHHRDAILPAGKCTNFV